MAGTKYIRSKVTQDTLFGDVTVSACFPHFLSFSLRLLFYLWPLTSIVNQFGGSQRKFLSIYFDPFISCYQKFNLRKLWGRRGGKRYDVKMFIFTSMEIEKAIQMWRRERLALYVMPSGQTIEQKLRVTVIIVEMSMMSIEKSRPQIVTSVYSPYTRSTRSQLRSERGSGTKAVRAWVNMLFKGPLLSWFSFGFA